MKNFLQAQEENTTCEQTQTSIYCFENQQITKQNSVHPNASKHQSHKKHYGRDKPLVFESFYPVKRAEPRHVVFERCHGAGKVCGEQTVQPISSLISNINGRVG